MTLIAGVSVRKNIQEVCTKYSGCIEKHIALTAAIKSIITDTILQIGWWHSGCGLVNLNGINSNSQLNTVEATAYNGIVWYPFFANTEGRGTQLEPDGGSWRSFKATEMKISANVDIEDGTHKT